MCGRFTLTADALELVEAVQRLQARLDAAPSFRPRFNVAPTQLHPILIADGESIAVQPARWGLVNSWARDSKRASKQINARSEGVSESRAYARPFKRQRCLVPADGWYEWSGPRSQRQPHWIHRADRSSFAFAGLYEIWRPQPERPAVTFTILTKPADRALASIHSRMPVLMPTDRQESWLDPGLTDTNRLRELIDAPEDDSLISISVSSRVNSVKHDDATLLQAESQICLAL